MSAPSSSSSSSSSISRPPSPTIRPSNPSIAPIHSLPKQIYHAVEYPGPVTHPTSILRVVTQPDVDDVFNAPHAESPWLDMNFREGGRAGGPVRGMRVPSQKILIRVRKRRRRTVEGDRGGADREAPGDMEGREGVFMSEVVGSVTQTVRFRAIADWHYTPDPDARIGQLLQSLQDLDYNAILAYEVPQLDETTMAAIDPHPSDPKAPKYRSLLDLQPAPMMTERKLPQIYHFKNAPQTYEEEVEDEYTGELKRRFVNRSRQVGFAPFKIGHGHPLGAVPGEPIKPVKERLGKLDQALLAKLQSVFEERPMWLRRGLLAQFTEAEQKIIITNKAYLPAVCYMFGAGPYWKCLTRFGYDPRQDPFARIYQHIYFYLSVNRTSILRNPLNAPIGTPDDEEKDADRTTRSWWEEEQEELVAQGKRPPLDPKKDYIFDGKVLHRDRPDFQLCDITDELISRYVVDPQYVAEACDSKDGWFKPDAMNLIKVMTRLKYVHVKEKSEPAPDSICWQAIEAFERGSLGDGADVEMAE